MFDSIALDVVIGLVFVYLLYSLLATILQELISTYFSFRAEFLELALKRMLDDEGKNSFVTLFYKHPLIKYLGQSVERSKPAYITRDTFSKVLIDYLRGDNIQAGDDIKSAIKRSLEDKSIGKGEGAMAIGSETLSYLNSLWVDSQGDVGKFRALLESWFDATMERASGWYKKRTQFVLLIIGFVVAVLFNVDTIEIASKLHKDPKLREQLVLQADNFLKAHPSLEKEIVQTKITDTSRVDSLKKLTVRRDTLINEATAMIQGDISKVNNVLGSGIGSVDIRSCGGLVSSLFGWCLTAVAISLGAPFWFDLLNKLMKLRSSIAVTSEGNKSQPASGQTQPMIDRKA